jgi:hypothetical protein
VQKTANNMMVESMPDPSASFAKMNLIRAARCKQKRAPQGGLLCIARTERYATRSAGPF